MICCIDVGHDVNGTPTHSPEHVEAVLVETLTRAGFDNMTVLHGVGYWESAREAQTTARLYLDGDTAAQLATLRTVAGEIRDTLKQDAVAFTVVQADVNFI